MNIIIPAAGLGKRFKDDGYSVPKLLINVLGKPMIVRVLESLKIGKQDKIFIVCNKSLRKYQFESILRKQLPNIDLNYIFLNFDTRGPADTVYCGLNQISNLEEGVLVVDCDNIYEEDVVEMARAKGDCIFYFQDESVDAIFSYIEVNDAGYVTAIKEKEKISDKACVGAYSFSSGELLMRYCEVILDLELVSKGEYYISDVYNTMLMAKKPILAQEVKKFDCLGTPGQLKAYCTQVPIEKMRFSFDLDGTLVTFPRIPGDYESVEPIQENIKIVKYLYGLGHTIIIQTSRKMLSSHLNAGLAAAAAYKTVFETLEQYEIPFDEIYFGKPFAHFYIDDLSVKPYEMEKETGFYHAHAVPRDFNKIVINGERVVKTTTNHGEIYWYEHIPNGIERHFPKYARINGDQVEMERIAGVEFSYLLINNSLTADNLNSLLKTLEAIHHSQFTNEELDLHANYEVKLRQRFSMFDYDRAFVGAPALLDELTKHLKKHVPMMGVIHGDPVFSNVFLCKNQLIRFIDMRGKLGDVETIFGDVFYDYAKVYQCLWGYDFIVNDAKINHPYLDNLRAFFEDFFVERFSLDQLNMLKYITASLFFSLIPLHSDIEKQKDYFTKAMLIIP